ncbi:hypothetical protein [Nonomuraea sp. NPDC049758]|uniref:hypothetical protein n=1 Tax=Nonomuraea sp. NPDC049758 TaxID=3154360 RepID=UPI003428FF36
MSGARSLVVLGAADGSLSTYRAAAGMGLRTIAVDRSAIELGLRTGGNGTDDMVRSCYGVDPVRAAVQAAVGLPIELRPHPPRPVLWRVLTAGRAGELVSVSGAAAARALPEVAELVLLGRPGQRVRPYRDVSDRLGWFVVHASGPAELDAAAAAVTRAPRFEVRGDGRR